MATEDPDQPADAGVCVLDCAETRCIDRPGTAPLVCAEVPGGESRCLGVASGYNEDCAAVPGTDTFRGFTSVCENVDTTMKNTTRMNTTSMTGVRSGDLRRGV